MTNATQTSARRRRIVTWLVLGAVFVLIGALLWAAQSATARQERGALHPTNHGPTGFNALTTVLGEHGVDVTVTDSWQDALQQAGTGTLAFVDAPALSDDALDALLAAADDVVLLQPTGRTLEHGLDAGYGDHAAASGACAVSTATRVSAAQLYVGGDAACLPGVDGAAGSAVISATTATHTVTAVDAESLFTNATITSDDNAALALALLGKHDSLVWYVPSVTDSDLTAENATLGDLAPTWVTPAIVLAAAVAVAAAVWRGRRFGPLVHERLPVAVRVAETAQGRARLYARSRDTGHVAMILRREAVASAGVYLGLGRRGTVAAVSAAAATALGVPTERVTQILAGPAPNTDAELLRLSDDLTRLDAAIRAAVSAEGKRP